MAATLAAYSFCARLPVPSSQREISLLFYFILETDFFNEADENRCILSYIMKKVSKAIDLIGLVTLLLGGLGAIAYAQAPPLSLPPLPGLPSTPSAPSVPSLSAPQSVPPATPKSGSVDVGAVDVTGKTNAGEKTGISTPPLPNESAEKAPGMPPLLPAPNVNTATAELPSLDVQAPLPNGVMQPNLEKAPAPLPIAVKNQVVEEPKKKESPKTWMTTLAPAVIPPKLGYNYRRELLPSEIYQKSYSMDNRHLPVAVTTDDYQQLFLMSVARNDINATRAFLNRGMPVNTVNANGETALALAQRYGAGDTAQLLILRGGR